VVQAGPTDPTSPHWYDETALTRLVFAHIGAARRGGRDLPLGEFIRSFAGLTSSTKAKTVRAALPGVERLSDFESDPAAIGTLLAVMKGEAAQPKPTALGHVPEDHYRTLLDDRFGVERFWFKRRRLTEAGVPWLVEVAVAETASRGTVVYGVNYSATFGDPFGQTGLRAQTRRATGAASFLAQADARPEYDNDGLRAAVVHVVCPALEFTDKGKVALTVPAAVAGAVAETLGDATKTLHREYKQAERDARQSRERAHRDAERARRRAVHSTEPEPRITLKDAVTAVMADAIAEASGGGTLPFPTRNLFYAVRPRIQALTDAELKMNYFSQTLVVEYEREHGRIPGMYRDPRGELSEPHTGKTVRLGTREVADYVLPSYVFDKILYVEKEGFNPLFDAVRLADRYDMAIASGKGQPVEAVRALFERAERGAYRLFVLHDADHSGYTIARAMSEETRRMPGYSVDVIDFGLSVADAVERGLPTEKYTRRAELPWWMPERLTEQERGWFEGRQIERKQWECTRVELNALGGPGLIDLIEAGLQRHKADSKVIPPANRIRWQARSVVDGHVRSIVDRVIAELIDPDEITRQVARQVAKPRVIGIRQATISRRLRNNSARSWSAAVAGEVSGRLNDDRINERVRNLLREQGIGGES
jgi:hypothetical protein